MLVGVLTVNSKWTAKSERALAIDFYDAIANVCTKYRRDNEARLLSADAAANTPQQQYVFPPQSQQAQPMQQYVPVPQQMQQQQFMPATAAQTSYQTVPYPNPNITSVTATDAPVFGYDQAQAKNIIYHIPDNVQGPTSIETRGNVSFSLGDNTPMKMAVPSFAANIIHHPKREDPDIY